MQNASEQTECITCGKLFSGRKSNRYWPDMWEAPRIGNGDGKDIAHTKPGARGKTFKQSPSANRSFKRTKTARRKS